jgi:tetratricopeptide (TPR) repeat protein
MESVTQNIPASSLNNSAIMYLQAGRSIEAMELLQIALSKLRDQFMDCHDSDWEDNCDEEEAIKHDVDEGEDDCMKCDQDFSEPCTKPISLFSSVPVRMPQDTSFLKFYDRALLVDTDCPCHDHELLSAVILFNMALLHHSRGIACCKADCFERASRLYQIALDILQKQLDYSTNYLLLMAIFNNLAHIDSHLFRMDEMKSSLEEIRTILTSDVIDDDALSLDEDDYAIFFMNAMFGNEKEITVAPAA